MSTRSSKKRKSIPTICEDEESKKPRLCGPQSRFTKFPKQSRSALAKKRQNTLTQIGAVPFSRSNTEDDDLDFEDNPTGPRKTRTYSKKRFPRQSETITQMDFLSPLANQENEDFVEEEVELVPSTPLRKGTRTDQPEAPTANTTRAGRVKHGIRGRPQKNSSSNTSLTQDLNQNRSEGTLHPSAATPPPPSCRIWKKEIPSSQTPPDTPLSTRSQMADQCSLRSPLKDRSTNVPSKATTTCPTRYPRPKLEIADSMEGPSEGNPDPADANSRAAQVCYMPPSIRIRSDSQMGIIKGAPRPSRAPLKVEPRERDGYSTLGATQIKSEIDDSEEEHDDEQDMETGQGSNYSDSKDWQAPNGGMPEAHSENPLPPSMTQVRDFGMMTTDHQLSSENISPLPQQTGDPPRTHFSHKTVPEQGPAEKSEGSNLDITQIPSSNPATSHHSPHYQRPSPPAGPETESQFENAWRDISPPPQLSPDMIPSSQPSSPDPNRNAPVSPEPASPNATGPFLIPRLPQEQAPVPPSQATTVDFTQPLIHSSTPRFLDLVSSSPVAQRSLPKRTHTLSPRKVSSSSLPPLSSSPEHTRKGGRDSWTDYGVGAWDGNTLTDSQLLPESLMNDSLVPPWWRGTQESLEEE